MPVGVGGLLDARVTHLLLDPSEIRPGLKHPRRVRVAGRVVLPVGESGLGEERLPDGLQEVPVSDDSAGDGGKHQLPLFWLPPPDLAFEVDSVEMGAERLEQGGTRRHPAILAILAWFDGTPLLGEGALDVDAAALPVNVALHAARHTPPTAGRPEDLSARTAPTGGGPPRPSQPAAGPPRDGRTQGSAVVSCRACR